MQQVGEPWRAIMSENIFILKPQVLRMNIR
jgi:hypothetical protein